MHQILKNLRALLVHNILCTLQLLGICATWADETVTKTKQAHGPILFVFASGTTGRVQDGSIKTEDGWLFIKGGSVQQNIDAIQTDAGSGECDFVLDEIPDVDAGTVRGKQSTCTVKQQFPLDPTKNWAYSASSVVVNVLSIDFTRNGKVSTVKIRVTPYAAVGTPTWTFDNNAAA